MFRLCLAHHVISPIVSKVVGLRLPIQRSDHMNHRQLGFELIGQRTCPLECIAAVLLQVNGTDDVFQGHRFTGRSLFACTPVQTGQSASCKTFEVTEPRSSLRKGP